MSQYIRLKVLKGKTCIYEKDFQIEAIFNQFLSILYGELLQRGIFYKNENISCGIIPGYQKLPEYNKEYCKEEARCPYSSKHNGRIYLGNISPENSDIPFSFFTVEFYSQKRANNKYMIYRRDMRLSELNFLQRSIDTVLFQRNLISSTELTIYNYFVRDDNSANFNKEYLNREDNSLGIKIHSTVQQEKIKRAFSAYQAEACDSPTADDLIILISTGCLNKLESIARQQQNRDIEVGGVLVGDLCEDEASQKIMVDIQDIISAEHTQASIASLLFTHQSWLAMNKKKKEFFPDKAILGWFHTHPFNLDERDTVDNRSSIFFSLKDEEIHMNLFKKKWHVAMVLGYEAREKGFFQWKGEKVIPCGGYYCYKKNGDK